MYFTVNIAFANYLDQLDETTDVPIDRNWKHQMHVLPIRFTVEDNKEDGSIPFLDTIVKPEADGSLSITVYRKPTHTDQ